MAEQGGPVDPLTQMAAAAVAVHELFVSLMAAGFTRHEALWLTAALTQGLKPPPGWDEPEKPGG